MKVFLMWVPVFQFYGPRVGALFVKEDMKGFLPLYPQLFGGGQERGLRPGKREPHKKKTYVPCGVLFENRPALYFWNYILFYCL